MDENVVVVHPILPIDHPLLREVAEPVTRFDPSLVDLAEEMFATLRAANGVGLAAPQIGQSIRLFVAEYEDQRVALCNPVITLKEGESTGAEGCLSLPGFVGIGIQRAANIEVQAQDLQGEPVTLRAEGLWARILQHEIDHLDGILFLDYLEEPSNLRRIRTGELDERAVADPVPTGSGS